MSLHTASHGGGSVSLPLRVWPARVPSAASLAAAEAAHATAAASGLPPPVPPPPEVVSWEEACDEGGAVGGGLTGEAAPERRASATSAQQAQHPPRSLGFSDTQSPLFGLPSVSSATAGGLASSRHASSSSLPASPLRAPRARSPPRTPRGVALANGGQPSSAVPQQHSPSSFPPSSPGRSGGGTPPPPPVSIGRRPSHLAPSPLALLAGDALSAQQQASPRAKPASPRAPPLAHTSPGMHSAAGAAAGGGGGGDRGGGGASLFAYSLRVEGAPLLRVSLRPGSPFPGGGISGVVYFPTPGEMGEEPGTPQPRDDAHSNVTRPPPGAADALRCVCLGVCLEREERVPGARARQRAAPPKGAPPQPAVATSVVDEWWEATADTQRTCFSFSLPADATPSFATAGLRLSYALRFDISAQRCGAGGGTEAVIWRLPIEVAPPRRRAA